MGLRHSGDGYEPYGIISLGCCIETLVPTSFSDTTFSSVGRLAVGATSRAFWEEGGGYDSGDT